MSDLRKYLVQRLSVRNRVRGSSWSLLTLEFISSLQFSLLLLTLSMFSVRGSSCSLLTLEFIISLQFSLLLLTLGVIISLQFSLLLSDFSWAVTSISTTSSSFPFLIGGSSLSWLLMVFVWDNWSSNCLSWELMLSSNISAAFALIVVSQG